MFLPTELLAERIKKEISPSFLEKKRMELITTEKYIQWLRKTLVILEAARLEREEKGLIKDLALEKAIDLLKAELERFKSK